MGRAASRAGTARYGGTRREGRPQFALARARGPRGGSGGSGG